MHEVRYLGTSISRSIPEQSCCELQVTIHLLASIPRYLSIILERLHNPLFTFILMVHIFLFILMIQYFIFFQVYKNIFQLRNIILKL